MNLVPLLALFTSVAFSAVKPLPKKAPPHPSSAPAPSSSVSYYAGTEKQFDSDGEKLKATTPMLLKRTLLKDKKLILEETLLAPEKKNQPVRRTLMVLTRTDLEHPGETSARFSAADEANTFSGEVLMRGDPWKWDRWAYNLQFRDGSRLEGEGHLDSKGFHTNQLTSNMVGVPQTNLVADLAPITEKDYLKRKKKFPVSK